MPITLDGDVAPGGQVVESITLAGPIERQVMAIAGWSLNEKAVVKNVYPGNQAYGLAVRSIPRFTLQAPNIVRTGVGDPVASFEVFAANTTRLGYAIENDDESGEGMVYVMEGESDASATNWVARLQGGERYEPPEGVNVGARISVLVTGLAFAQCMEWVP